MNSAKVTRDRLTRLTDLPNVGPAFAGDLELLGINRADQLRGQDPLHLYRRLARKTGIRQDPCVLDTFMSLTDFMNGAPPRPWWSYTKERKQRYGLPA
jgi:hypothetical protein